MRAPSAALRALRPHTAAHIMDNQPHNQSRTTPSESTDITRSPYSESGISQKSADEQSNGATVAPSSPVYLT